MALNNLLNLPPSKVAPKPPLPPLPTRPSVFLAPRQFPPCRPLLRSKPPPPRQGVQSSTSPPSGTANNTPSPPSSRQEAVAQARSCLAAALQKPLNNSIPLKKLKRQRQSRFRAEIPVVDESPGSLARLALDVFSGGAGASRKGAPARLLLVWPSAEALSVALREFENQGDNSATAHGRLGSVAPGALSACDAAVFLATGPAQVEQVRAAAAALEPKPVVLFNPAWIFDEEEEEEKFGAGARGFVGSFDVVYSFTGLEVRGLLTKKRGVLLRCVEAGRFGGESWVLMVENDDGAPEGQEFKVVSRLKKRPTIGEVETMLYNLMAANSPVTKSARFLREMVSNVTGGKSKAQ